MAHIALAPRNPIDAGRRNKGAAPRRVSHLHPCSIRFLRTIWQYSPLVGCELRCHPGRYKLIAPQHKPRSQLRGESTRRR